MTRYRDISPCVAWLLLLMLAAGVDAGAQTRTLTLEEALRLADEQSVDVRKARAALERAERGIESARALFLPEVTATGDYTINLQRPVLFVAPGNPFNETGSTQVFPIGSRHATGLALNVMQPLYDPIRRMQRAVAEADAGVSEARLGMARALVRFNTERAYYRALYAKSERDARAAQIESAMKNFEITLARFRGGRAMALDTLTAEVSVMRARADAERSRYNYLASLLALAQLLEIEGYQNLEVAGELEIPTTPGPSGGDMTLSLGRLNSAAIKVAEAQRAAAQTGVELESYSAYPTVNAVGRWQALGQSNSTVPDDFSWAMTSHIGVSAYYPIFNLWRGNPAKEIAEIRVREAELEMEQLRQNDSARVETLLLLMKGARAQVIAEEASVERARKAVDITMVLYKEGRATLLDVENAQARVRDAELAVDMLQLQFMEAYAELKALVGE